MRRLLGSILLTLVLLACGGTLCAAETADSLTQAADSLFAAGEFEAVELLALRVGERPAEMSEESFANLQVTAGFAMIMLEREAEAREYFFKALEHSPELRLDPIAVSPKFRVVFDDVRSEFEQRAIEPEPVVTNKPQVQASSRVLNLLLPGAGFIREGEAVRGGGWLGLQLASAAWFAVSLSDMADSRENYLAQSDPARIRSAYDAYNDDHRMAWTAGIVAGAMYVLCQADLAVYSPPDRETAQKKFALYPGRRGLTFVVRW